MTILIQIILALPKLYSMFVEIRDANKKLKQIPKKTAQDIINDHKSV